MRFELSLRCRTIKLETYRQEGIFAIKSSCAALRPVAGQQFGHLSTTEPQCLFIKGALRESFVLWRRCIRGRPLNEAPLGQLKIIVLESGTEMPPRGCGLRSLVKHVSRPGIP